MKTSLTRGKNRIKGTRGFTLAEMLIVVAIVMVLTGVSFISVQSYQRSLAQLERDGIAKQLFVAAQNHLSATQREEYRKDASGNLTGVGLPGGADAENKKKVYYYVVTNGAVSGADEYAFERMLPFGALDETVRVGGSYLIRYQPEAGIVTDVFYCSTRGTPEVFNHILSTDETEYNIVMGLTGAGNKAARRNYTYGDNSVLGWYGGSEAEVREPMELKPPTIEVINAETLSVVVKDTDNQKYENKYSLKLIVTGNTSGAKKSFLLLKSENSKETDNNDETKARISGASNSYTVILDDITKKDMHFSDLGSEVPGRDFIPGENITVQAVAYSTEEFANVAYSARRTANSLFSGISDAIVNSLGEKDGVPDTASISNFRHLENLDKIVSNLDANDTSNKLNISAAVQIANLNWKTDDGAYWPSKTVVPSNGKTMDAEYSSQYYPVSPNYALSFDGKNHSITGVTANAANAGLFGVVSVNGSEIKNLELIDFTVTGTTNAGALAGSASNTTVTNVLARNSSKTGAAVDITATNGSAGGLIGTVTGGSVENCAAALIVNGSTNAGGLIGAASGNVSVSRCYSGGHTKNGNYKDWVTANRYDVVGATAGGLVGSFAGSAITESYSTCSVSGTTTAGGFAGTAGGSITNCYCTGLVTGTNEGAFAGFLSGAASGCLYYEIVNERADARTGHACLKAVGNQDRDGRITPLDNDMSAYEGFVGGESTWDSASAYDVNLRIYYKNKFPLQTVFQLEKNDKTLTLGKTEFVRTHFGDWPAPETFVINN